MTRDKAERANQAMKRRTMQLNSMQMSDPLGVFGTGKKEESKPKKKSKQRAESPSETSLKGSISNLKLYSDFQPNDQTLEGSFSSVSTPNFARKYSLESS